MRNLILLCIGITFISCNNGAVEKPKNLIDEDQMVNIIYDISLLDAMKNQNMGAPIEYPTTTELLKSKYKIDSLTFAKSSQYYAADYKKYKEMYEEVKLRLEEETRKANGGQPVAPNLNEGIVR